MPVSPSLFHLWNITDVCIAIFGAGATIGSNIVNGIF